MEKALPDAKVSNYEQLIPSLELPDQDDRHVLAAAIHCKAELIITFNLKDFPAEILKHYKIKAQHPDEFACMLLERSPNQVIEVVKDQLKSLRNPPKSMRQMLADFEQRGLELFPKLLLEYFEN